MRLQGARRPFSTNEAAEGSPRRLFEVLLLRQEVFVDSLAPFLPFVVVILAFWLLLILPAQRRQKAVQKLQANLQPGDRVVLTSGIFATLVDTADGRARVLVADGVVLEVALAAIGAVEKSDVPSGPEDFDG